MQIDAEKRSQVRQFLCGVTEYRASKSAMQILSLYALSGKDLTGVSHKLFKTAGGYLPGYRFPCCVHVRRAGGSVVAVGAEKMRSSAPHKVVYEAGVICEGTEPP